MSDVILSYEGGDRKVPDTVAPIDTEVDLSSRKAYTDVRPNHDFIFLQLQENLADKAYRASKWYSRSYRDFRVGAVAYVIDETGDRTGILFGANYKPTEDGPRFCAEVEVMRKVEQRGFDRVIALVVCGPPQADDVSGIEHSTLHPCASCREMFEASPFVDDQTIVMTVGEYSNELDFDYEILRVGELIKIHDPQSS